MDHFISIVRKKKKANKIKKERRERKVEGWGGVKVIILYIRCVLSANGMEEQKERGEKERKGRHREKEMEEIDREWGTE